MHALSNRSSLDATKISLLGVLLATDFMRLLITQTCGAGCVSKASA